MIIQVNAREPNVKNVLILLKKAFLRGAGGGGNTKRQLCGHSVTRFYERVQNLMKATISHDILFGQIPCFCSVSFACNVLFAFCNFVL